MSATLPYQRRRRRGRRPPLVALAMAFACLVSPWNAVDLKGIQPVDLILGAVLVAVSARALVRDDPMAKMPAWLVAGCSAILLVGAYHTLFSQSISQLDRSVRWILAAGLLPWLAVMCSRRWPALGERLALWWVIGIAASASVGIADYFGVTNINDGLVPVPWGGDRQAGLSAQPNHLGLACAMALPLVAHFTRRRWTAAGVGLLLFGGVIVSGSRAAQAAFVLALLPSLAGPARNRRVVKMTILSAIAIAIALTLSGSARSQVQPLLRIFSEHSADTEESNAGRAQLAEQAWDSFLSNPILGGGMDQLSRGHSVPLQLLATGGAVLALACFVYGFGAVRSGRKLARASGDQLVRAAAWSAVVWFAAGIVSNSIADRFLYVPIAVILVARDGELRRRSTGQ